MWDRDLFTETCRRDFLTLLPGVLGAGWLLVAWPAGAKEWEWRALQAYHQDYHRVLTRLWGGVR